MRLEIPERGHRPGKKAVLTMIRLVSRQPVVDAVKLAFYRPDFYGAGDLTHEAMRGPSTWSIGDRELMATCERCWPRVSHVSRSKTRWPCVWRLI